MPVAGTIKTLLVKLGVDSAGYERDLTVAEKRAKNFDKVLTGAFAGAALAASALIAKSTMLAARVQTLGVVVTRLGKSANYTQEQLDTYEESIKSQGITTQNTLQAMAQMMQAQVDLAEGSNLARIAQDNAVIANINSSEAFQRLVTVLQTGNVLMGRTMGLNLDFAGSQKKLADELGKTTDALNDAEVMQARLNEVKRAGVAIEGTYEAAMGTAGKTMLSMDRQFEEVSLMIGNIFLPVLTEAVDLIYETVKGINEFLNVGKKLSTQELKIAKELAKSGGSYEDLVAQVTAAAEEQGKYVYTQEALLDTFPDVRSAFEMMTEGYRLMGEEQFDLITWIEQGVNAHEDWRASVVQGTEATRNAASGTRAMGASMDEVERAAADAESAVTTFWGTLREGPGIVSALESNLEALDYSQAGADAIVEAQAAVEEALATGLITEAQADQAFGNLYVAAQQMEVELGNITAYQAALNIRENVGGSLREARAAVDNLEKDLLELVERELELRIKAIVSYGEGLGGQYGLSMTVPPGFPNDSYPIMATSGEHVEITPQGEDRRDQSTRIGPINVSTDMDESMFLDKLKRTVARS